MLPNAIPVIQIITTISLQQHVGWIALTITTKIALICSVMLVMLIAGFVRGPNNAQTVTHHTLCMKGNAWMSAQLNQPMKTQLITSVFSALNSASHATLISNALPVQPKDIWMKIWIFVLPVTISVKDVLAQLLTNAWIVNILSILPITNAEI